MRVLHFIPDHPWHARAHVAGLAILAMLAAFAAASPVLAQEHAATQPAATSDAQPAAPAGQQGHAAPADTHAAPVGDTHAAAAGEHAEAGAHGEDAAHGESIWSFLSRIANFLLLAGGIWYFAKSPLGKYLASKADQIRHDLAHAERTRHEAEARLAAIEEQMKALPAELDGLRARGAAEIAAEEARIRELAATERERLLEHTRREINTQVRAARRDLARHAAELAVDVATARIKNRITDDDHARLVDRYVTQVKSSHD